MHRREAVLDRDEIFGLHALEASDVLLKDARAVDHGPQAEAERRHFQRVCCHGHDVLQ